MLDQLIELRIDNILSKIADKEKATRIKMYEELFAILTKTLGTDIADKLEETILQLEKIELKAVYKAGLKDAGNIRELLV